MSEREVMRCRDCGERWELDEPSACRCNPAEAYDNQWVATITGSWMFTDEDADDPDDDWIEGMA